jgi:uncharacterized protein
MNVFACTLCGQCDFPRRLLCAHCGNDLFNEVDAATGRVEEVTVLHHRAGKPGSEMTCLATLLTDAGPRVIARLARPLAPGTVVGIQCESDGALVAFAL